MESTVVTESVFESDSVWSQISFYYLSFCLSKWTLSIDLPLDSGFLQSLTSTEHSVFKAHPCCSMCWYFIHFYGWQNSTVWIYRSSSMRAIPVCTLLPPVPELALFAWESIPPTHGCFKRTACAKDSCQIDTKCQFNGPENGVTYIDSERSLKYAESSSKGVQMGLKIAFVESLYMK